MQEPGDEPPAKRTRIASHAGANTAVGSLKLRLLVLLDTEASTSVDASKRLAWARLGHQHSWAPRNDVLCKIGNGCETQSPIITQNIMHRMTITNRTKVPKIYTTVGKQSGMKLLHCVIIASQHCHYFKIKTVRSPFAGYPGPQYPESSPLSEFLLSPDPLGGTILGYALIGATL